MLLAARVMLDRDKPDDAKSYLKPIAYNPHGGAATAIATKLLALVDAGDKAGALALFSVKNDDATKAKGTN